VSSDHRVGEGFAQAEQGAPGDAVLEARQGGLGRQGCPGDRIAANQELVDGIVGQAGGVVGVGVAWGQGEQALAEQLFPFVNHVAALAGVSQAGAEPLAQAQPAVGRPQQDAAAGTAPRLVETGQHGLGKKILGADTGCRGRLTHAKALRRGKQRLLTTALYHTGGLRTSTFMSDPG
jgi:hypothetical protein